MDNEAPLSTDNDEADPARSEEAEPDATSADTTETAALGAPADDALPEDALPEDVPPDDATGVRTTSAPRLGRAQSARAAAAQARRPRAPYPGPIIGITRGWVSRDSAPHVFAARYLDFAVLTEEHLMCCSTGFFSRQPRRRVFREPLQRDSSISPRGSEPIPHGADRRRLQPSPALRAAGTTPNSLAFARRAHRAHACAGALPTEP